MADPTTPPPPAATTAPAPETALAAGAAAAEVKSADVGTPAGTAPAEGTKPAETKPAEAPKPLELKVPEGFDVDTKAVDGFKALAGELGLDAAKAQKIFDSYVGLSQALQKQADEAFAAQDSKWVSELKADPELQMGGPKWAAARADIGRAVSRFKAQESLAALNAAGLGNHPAIVRLFAGIGRALREDSIAGATRPADSGERLSDAQVFYGTPTSAAKES